MNRRGGSDVLAHSWPRFGYVENVVVRLLRRLVTTRSVAKL